MHPFKMILGGAMVAGAMSGCVISTGGTDTNLSLSSLSDGTDSSSGTDSTASTTASTGTDGTGTDSASTTDAPTTGDVPTTSETTSSTSTTSDTTTGGGVCGWSANDSFYGCSFEGEDPNGTPIGCPDGLVEGDPCSDTGLTGQGCCDANGNNWYCGQGDVVVTEACG